MERKSRRGKESKTIIYNSKSKTSFFKKYKINNWKSIKVQCLRRTKIIFLDGKVSQTFLSTKIICNCCYFHHWAVCFSNTLTESGRGKGSVPAAASPSPNSPTFAALTVALEPSKTRLPFLHGRPLKVMILIDKKERDREMWKHFLISIFIFLELFSFFTSIVWFFLTIAIVQPSPPVIKSFLGFT